MPRKKKTTDEGTMLTPTAVESTGWFEQTEPSVAVLDTNYSDTTKVAIESIEADKKMWRTLATETAAGAAMPPEFLLKKLASAVGLNELVAQQKFSEDVQALKKLKKAEAAQARYETKVAEFVSEHATEQELQQQLKDMLQSVRDLRSLINEIQNYQRVCGQNKAAARGIRLSFTRLF